MSAWLNRQRKGDLQVLAEAAGITGYDGMLKEELVSSLDYELRHKAAKLAGNPKFSEYYERSSPVKGQRAAMVRAGSSEDSGRPRRRATRVKEEFDSMVESAVDTPPSMALATRTPRAVQRVAERVPLPPSPAVIAEAVERQTAVAKEKLDDLWADSGITEATETVREALSTVMAIGLVIVGVEATGLNQRTLPWEWPVDIPAINAVGTSSHRFYLPNFFRALEGPFWSQWTLWASTSFFIPMVFAYFFNLTLSTKRSSTSTRRTKAVYQVDPLAFNITKALVTWLVYSQGIRFGGMVSDETVASVNYAVYGGYQGILIGAAIGGIASLYEAALRK